MYWDDSNQINSIDQNNKTLHNGNESGEETPLANQEDSDGGTEGSIRSAVNMN